jgi:hypothetical protein
MRRYEHIRWALIGWLGLTSIVFTLGLYAEGKTMNGLLFVIAMVLSVERIILMLFVGLRRNPNAPKELKVEPRQDCVSSPSANPSQKLVVR